MEPGIESYLSSGQSFFPCAEQLSNRMPVTFILCCHGAQEEVSVQATTAFAFADDW